MACSSCPGPSSPESDYGGRGMQIAACRPRPRYDADVTPEYGGWDDWEQDEGMLLDESQNDSFLSDRSGRSAEDEIEDLQDLGLYNTINLDEEDLEHVDELQESLISLNATVSTTVTSEEYSAAGSGLEDNIDEPNYDERDYHTPPPQRGRWGAARPPPFAVEGSPGSPGTPGSPDVSYDSTPPGTPESPCRVCPGPAPEDIREPDYDDEQYQTPPPQRGRWGGARPPPFAVEGSPDRSYDSTPPGTPESPCRVCPGPAAEGPMEDWSPQRLGSPQQPIDDWSPQRMGSPQQPMDDWSPQRMGSPQQPMDDWSPQRMGSPQQPMDDWSPQRMGSPQQPMDDWSPQRMGSPQQPMDDWSPQRMGSPQQPMDDWSPQRMGSPQQPMDDWSPQRMGSPQQPPPQRVPTPPRDDRRVRLPPPGFLAGNVAPPGPAAGGLQRTPQGRHVQMPPRAAPPPRQQVDLQRTPQGRHVRMPPRAQPPPGPQGALQRTPQGRHGALQRTPQGRHVQMPPRARPPIPRTPPGMQGGALQRTPQGRHAQMPPRARPPSPRTPPGMQDSFERSFASSGDSSRTADLTLDSSGLQSTLDSSGLQSFDSTYPSSFGHSRSEYTDPTLDSSLDSSGVPCGPGSPCDRSGYSADVSGDSSNAMDDSFYGGAMNQTYTIDRGINDQTYTVEGGAMNQTYTVEGGAMNQTYTVAGGAMNQTYNVYDDGGQYGGDASAEGFADLAAGDLSGISDCGPPCLVDTTGDSSLGLLGASAFEENQFDYSQEGCGVQDSTGDSSLGLLREDEIIELANNESNLEVYDPEELNRTTAPRTDNEEVVMGRIYHSLENHLNDTEEEELETFVEFLEGIQNDRRSVFQSSMLSA